MIKYQSLTPPEDAEFELNALFAAYGVNSPSESQFYRLRQWLTDHGFIRERIHLRKEFWIKEGLSRRRDPELMCRYTINSFISKFFPGAGQVIDPPSFKTPLVEKLKRFDFIKVMRKRGLRPRMGGLYWSYSVARRRSLPIKRLTAKPQIPKHIKFPLGSFSAREFLEFNNMRLYQENFAWARSYLPQHTRRLPRTRHYMKPDHRGVLPPLVTGAWQIPGPAFTTYQFQQVNQIRYPNSRQWQSAVNFLTQSGYQFDPKWKRWKKQTP